MIGRDALRLVSASDAPATVRLDRVGVAYRGRSVLREVSGTFAQGSLTAIVGPNGAGKSTLLKAMAGLVPLSEGRVTRELARDGMAYLAQQSSIERGFPLSVLDCVCLGFWPAARIWHRVSRAQREAACDALAGVGLGDVLDRPVGTLSAGQFQRMLFVRVQLQDARFILLDEPFNAVDAATTDALLHVIADWHAQGRTVVAVLHDHAQVRAWFPQTLLLAHSPVAWGQTADVLCDANLRHVGQLADVWHHQAA